MTRPLALSVKRGDGADKCPLCGILRRNAGFLKETCGTGYGKPDCFVAAGSRVGATPEAEA